MELTAANSTRTFRFTRLRKSQPENKFQKYQITLKNRKSKIVIFPTTSPKGGSN